MFSEALGHVRTRSDAVEFDGARLDVLKILRKNWSGFAFLSFSSLSDVFRRLLEESLDSMKSA